MKEGGRAIDWQLPVLATCSSFCGSYVCSDVPPESPLFNSSPLLKMFSSSSFFSNSSLPPVFSNTSLRHSHLTRRCFNQSWIIPFGSLKPPLCPFLTVSCFPSLAPGLHSVHRRLYRRHLAMYQRLHILLLSNLCPHTQSSAMLLSNLLCTFLRVSLMQQARGDASL